jgi:hypothetical protein
MSKCSEEEKRRILREIRAAIAQVDDVQAAAAFEAASAVDSAVEDEPAAWPSRRDILDHRQRSSAPMNRWRAEAEETERRRQQDRERSKREQEEQVRQMTQADASWNAWLRAGIERALAEDWELKVQILGRVVSEERERERKEIKRAVDKLRVEFSRQLRELRAELQDDGKIIDLPKGSWQRHVA